jgi:hypothetical protein
LYRWQSVSRSTLREPGYFMPVRRFSLPLKKPLKRHDTCCIITLNYLKEDKMRKMTLFLSVLFMLIFAFAGCKESVSHEDGDAEEEGDVEQDGDGVQPDGRDVRDAPDAEVPPEVTPDVEPDVEPDVPVDVPTDACTGPGMMECGGVCVDTRSDPAHCGDCDTACSDPTPFCVDGACSAECPEHYVNCDGVCVDLSNDLANCGGCGHACPTGADCISGHCVCPDPTTDCVDVCADLQNDPTHCGDCDTSCGRLGTCVDGDCAACTDPATDCGGECVDTDTDTSHCGNCTTSCRTAEMCVDGSCECRTGLTFCTGGGGGCYDLDVDARHCGDCATTCGYGEVCYAGACSDTPCADQTPPAVGCGYGGATNNCVLESDFATDPLHCGDCTTRCDADEVCVGGSCTGYVGAFGCSACPCDFCFVFEACCLYPETTDVPICVEGGTCP